MDLLNSPHVKHILLAIGILVFAFILSKIVRVAINRYIRRSSLILKTDPTHYNFFKNTVSGLIYGMAVFLIFYTIPEFKSLGLTLFASAGVLAAILGFASQQAFSNIISGLFIVIFKPFRVGDLIKVGAEQQGVVEDITLRHTVIKTFENRRLVIPNTEISAHTILNSSLYEEATCIWVEMGISYDSDIDLAMKIMQEESVLHQDFHDLRTEEDIKNEVPAVVVRVTGFGDSSVNLRAQVWSDDPVKGMFMKFDLHKSIKERFDREGIEIPFPYRTLVFKNPLERKSI